MLSSLSGGMSSMRDFFKRYVPTSDPDDLHTPPLPVEELHPDRIAELQAEVTRNSAFHPVGALAQNNAASPRQSERLANLQPRPSSLSPTITLGNQMNNLDLSPYSDSSTLSLGSAISMRSNGKVTKKKTPATPKREFSRESSIDGMAKRTRSYKLKNDEQRSNPEYQKIRKENNEAVKRSRQKKAEKEAEAKRKDEEEKELYRSTIVKLLELYEWDSIVHSSGLFILPATTMTLNLGDMNTDQWTLVEELRSELRLRAARVARR